MSGDKQESSAPSGAVFPDGRAESIAGRTTDVPDTFGKTRECALEKRLRVRSVAARLSLLRQVLGLAILLLLPGIGRSAEEPLAARVVLVANSDDPDSLRIARHYAEVRGVPVGNIIALKLPLGESITWREFVALLWQPLQDELVRARWIDAIPMTLTDEVGRRKLAVQGHRIAALVTCRGVPLKIEHDPALFTETPLTRKAEFRTNAGAVDSELSLLAHPNYLINAFVRNPLFQNEDLAAAQRAQIIRVSRLDGPTVDDALGLVDRAVAAERTGLLGRAYVDIGGIHALGDQWLEEMVGQLKTLRFTPVVERTPATLAATTRADAPVLYFGWYASNLNGPFALPGFRFPPGAIAIHIHSYSAHTIRSTTAGWTGPLVARGVTATVGNVFEPYLEFTHRPPLLLKALARGATLAEAAYYSLPVLSWHTVLIGDPLYRPFAVSLEAQLKEPGKLPPLLAGYATLRKFDELLAAQRRDEALVLARTAQRETPSLALGVALAGALRDGGDNESAASALGFIALLKTLRPDEWALAREAARMLEELGRPARAVELWQLILETSELPRELRVAWLGEASQAATTAQDSTQARKWDHALADLTGVEKK
jgi:uncharacterized protein (TIGR03790 family)